MSATDKPNPLDGPYDVGTDGYGHGTNSAGRCAPLNADPNATPPTCPTAADRSSYLNAQPMSAVKLQAGVLGVTVALGVLQPVLVALVVAAEVAQDITHA